MSTIHVWKTGRWYTPLGAVAAQPQYLAWRMESKCNGDRFWQVSFIDDVRETAGFLYIYDASNLSVAQFRERVITMLDCGNFSRFLPSQLQEELRWEVNQAKLLEQENKEKRTGPFIPHHPV